MSVEGLRRAFVDLDEELQATRRVIERIPEDRFDFRPHERSWTVGELATHLANLLTWGHRILRVDEVDLEEPFPLERPGDARSVLAVFDGNAKELRAAFDDVGEATLVDPWTLRSGSRVLDTRPRHVALRTWVLMHLAHHRAQLGVYLRLLDIPVPPVYGPTADEDA